MAMCTDDYEFDAPDLQRMWAEAARRQRNWEAAGEAAHLAVWRDAYNALLHLGWRDAHHAPTDRRILGIGGSGHVRVHQRLGAHWFAEDAGDLWPSRPVLWKELPE